MNFRFKVTQINNGGGNPYAVAELVGTPEQLEVFETARANSNQSYRLEAGKLTITVSTRVLLEQGLHSACRVGGTFTMGINEKSGKTYIESNIIAIVNEQLEIDKAAKTQLRIDELKARQSGQQPVRTTAPVIDDEENDAPVEEVAAPVAEQDPIVGE